MEQINKEELREFEKAKEVLTVCVLRQNRETRNLIKNIESFLDELETAKKTLKNQKKLFLKLSGTERFLKAVLVGTQRLGLKIYDIDDDEINKIVKEQVEVKK